MKKTIMIIAATLVVLVVAGGAYVWYAMQQPLYEPGMVRSEKNSRAPLTPPEQSENSQFWRVELKQEAKVFHLKQMA